MATAAIEKTEPSAPAGNTDDANLSQAFAAMASEGFDASKPMGDLETPPSSFGTPTPPATPAAPETPEVEVAPAATGDTPVDPAKPADDPLAGTEPYTYGDTKTPIEGVYRVPGEGLMIPEDKAHIIDDLATQRDTLAREVQQFRDSHGLFERVSSFTVKGADGKEQTLTGLAGIENMRLAHARTNAAFNSMMALFVPDAQGSYPLMKLLTVEKVPDGKGGFVDRPTLHADLWDARITQSEIAEIEAEQRERTKMGSLWQAPAKPTDYAAHVPRFIEAIAKDANLDAKLLTPEQTKTLTDQINRYVVKQDGKELVDEGWQDLVRQFLTLSAGAKAQAVAAERAGKLNAGMDKGRQPVKPVAKPAAPAATKENKGRPRADWNGPLDTALAEMNIPR